LKNYSPRIIP